MIDDWIEVGPPINPSESRAFVTIRSALENAPEAYTVVTNVRLPNGRSDYYEYDAIVVGQSIVFAIEVKGYGGRVTCQRDLWFFENGDSCENPSNRLSTKTKTLGSLLIGRHRTLRNKLWLQDLVYVNGPNVKLVDADYARRASFDVLGTVFDSEVALRSALLDTKRWCRPERFADDEREAIVAYLRGGEKRVVDERLGKYVVEERLAATSERYDRLLMRDRYQPPDAPRVEVHVYPLDGRRVTEEELGRLFTRQIGVVRALGDAGVTARYLSDDESDWHGRRVRYIAYEWLGRFETLGDWSARTGAPGLREGLRLGIALADAIAAMHDQGVVHGALEPSSLYLRNDAEKTQIAIGRIELARPQDAGMSVTSSTMMSATASSYASPDVLANRHPKVDDDLFSFGAILAHVLRGRPLFASPNEILRALRIPRLVEDRSADPPELHDLVRDLLSRSPLSRPRSMRDVSTRLRMLLAPLEQEPRDPKRFGNFRVVRELRAGATGRTVVAERLDLEGEVVLKIAQLGSDETLRHEVETLRRLQQPALHPNIVVAYDAKTLEHEGVLVGEFGLVPGEDGERLRGKVLAAWLLPFVDGLFSALAFVHARGIVHRDVKPANVMIGSDGKATLLDFGLACAPNDENLVVGTAPYKSEQLFSRGHWTARDDVFAAATTLWEIATAQHPWNGDAPHGEPRLDPADLGMLLEADAAEKFASIVRDILLDTSDPLDAADQARSQLLAVLDSREQKMTLPLPFEVKLLAAVGLGDAVAVVDLSRRARGALDDLGVATVGDVLQLTNADLRSVRVFGRGVTDELAALRVALVGRFGESLEAETSVLRSVQAAFAPVLIADSDATSALLEVLGLAPSLVASLAQHSLVTVATLAGADPRVLERDERIGPSGIRAIRAALRDYVDDRERLVVEAALPPWRVAPRGEFVDGVARVGGDATQAVRTLEIAGGFELKCEDVPQLGVPLVAAPPWRQDELVAALERIGANASWPPSDITELSQGIVVPPALGPEAGLFFVERMAPLVGIIAATSDGRFYAREALTLEDAFVFGADTLALPATAQTFAAAVERRLPSFRVPSPTSDAFATALERAGFILLPDNRIDRKDAVAEANARVRSELAGAEVVSLSAATRRLLAAVPRGGYRLVVAEPAIYVARVRKLVSELRSALGDRLRVVDVDAELCHLLREAGHLEMAMQVQAKRGLVFDVLAAVAGGVTRAILNGLLTGEPGTTTIAINAGSLGLTGVCGHLGAIYIEAHGGRHGLVVVCVPGDHPNAHARLNRDICLPISPMVPPIALDEAA